LALKALTEFIKNW